MCVQSGNSAYNHIITGTSLLKKGGGEIPQGAKMNAAL